MSRLSLFVLLVVSPLAAFQFAHGIEAAGCYLPPVDAPVTDPFRAPMCEFCAGNRGLEYGTASGQSVVAVSGGTVRFSGVVARSRYVVIAQDDGLRATYGRLLAAEVSVGEHIPAGGEIGTATDQFFFGLRAAGEHHPDRYLDPAPLLGQWRRPSRLVPLDGSARRPGRAPRLVCRNTEADR